MIYPKLHRQLWKNRDCNQTPTPRELFYLAGKTGRVWKGVAKTGISFAELGSESVCLVPRPGQSQNQRLGSECYHTERLAGGRDVAGMQGWLRTG